MSEEIREKVNKIIAEQAMIDVSKVTETSTPEELGLDSLALVEIVFSIEEEFGVSVPYNANDPEATEFDISTVKSVQDGVVALVNGQG